MLSDLVRHQLRRLVLTIPGAYAGLVSLSRSRRERLVRSRTEVVIEGFPRSGNTYALATFMVANPGVAAIAHHLHLPIQLVRAARYGTPILVVVRHPVQAVASLMVMKPDLPARLMLRDYAAFHRALADRRGRVASIGFERLVRDPGAVADLLNTTFGTGFNRYVTTTESERVVRELVESWDRRLHDGRVDPLQVALPSDERLELLERARYRLRTDLGLRAALETAEAVYREVVTDARVHPNA